MKVRFSWLFMEILVKSIISLQNGENRINHAYLRLSVLIKGRILGTRHLLAIAVAIGAPQTVYS